MYSPTSSIIFTDYPTYTTQDIFITSTDVLLPSTTITPVSDIILTPSSPIYPLSDILSLELLDNQPKVALVYESVNNDPQTKYMMVKYLYYLVLDDWLYSDLSDILNYFNYGDNRVTLTREPKQIINIDSDEVVEKKIDYIEKNIFTKYDMAKVIIKFLKETKTLWVDLPKNKYLLKPAVREYLIKKIRKELRSNK